MKIYIVMKTYVDDEDEVEIDSVWSSDAKASERRNSLIPMDRIAGAWILVYEVDNLGV